MKFKSPSPKILAFLIIVVILTTITIVVGKLSNHQSSTSNLPINLIIENSLKNDIDPKDTDGDNLPDWQEEIWGSDKNNIDTDGDGTSDGEEVNQNRNPVVAGPEDKILSDQEIALQIVPGETDPDSVTSILSKNLLLRLAQLEQSGQYNTQSGEQLAQNLANQALNEVQIPEKYPQDLFLTFDSSDSEKLNNYTDTIIKIQYEELVKAKYSGSMDIDSLISSFKNMAFQLSIIPVPKDLVAVHTKITNNYYIAAEALINLKLSEKDPILGILSIPIYKKASEEQPILYKQVQNYLESNGIIFDE